MRVFRAFGIKASILAALAANKVWGPDVRMPVRNAGFTVAPSEAAHEQKFSSQQRLDQEFEAGTSSYSLILKM